MGKVYIALLHHPIYNKRKDIVSTCITGFDLHDIARTALTFGIEKYYVVNPLSAQREFAQRIVEFWMEEGSQEFNWTRAAAFKLLSIKDKLDDVLADLPKDIKVIATSAKKRGTVRYEKLRSEIKGSDNSYLVLFGTGWGMAEEVFEKVDEVLDPIIGKEDYNHLPVRSAIAIILDRLLGR
jgi:hypothetical protein